LRVRHPREGGDPVSFANVTGLPLSFEHAAGVAGFEFSGIPCRLALEASLHGIFP
jgi:hypothetical protein